MHTELHRWRSQSPNRRVAITEDKIVLSELTHGKIRYRSYATEKMAVYAVMQGLSL